jgi:uncharacterized protein with PQ loop repeat
MYLFIVLAVAACAVAVVGLLQLIDGFRGKNTEKILRSSYWLLAAVVTALVGLVLLVAT